MSREEEIRERLEAATPGPWFAVRYYVGAGEDHGDPDAEIATAGTKTDAEFIAHARQDVPYLLDENARLRAQLDAVREVADNAELIPIHVGGGNLVNSQLMVRHSKLRAALNQGGETNGE